MAGAHISGAGAPVLESRRLILRGHGLDDFEAGFAIWSDPNVVRYITGKASTREECWSRILRYAGHWALLEFGFWAVEEKDSGHFVGDVGFGNFKRTIEPSLDPTPEIGWVLNPAMHGRGYATEAVHAALSWSDQHLSAPATVCMVSPENLPSLRVAQKCGYREMTRSTYQDSEIIILRRERNAPKPQ